MSPKILHLLWSVLFQKKFKNLQEELKKEFKMKKKKKE